MTNLTGLVLDGRYRLRECLESGTFGLVYAADELLRGRRIARCCLKLLLPDSNDTPELVREITHLARVAHPRVIAYRGCGEVRRGTLKGSLYLAMELAERSLRNDLERSSLSPAELLEVVQATAEGMAFLHELELVHRDIKPDNLLLANGSWKLTDFGLTRSLASLQKLGPLPGGTAAYKAPEVLTGRTIGTAVDMWALGVIVQESLTGQFPYPDEEEVDLSRHVLWHDPVVESLLEPFGWLTRGLLAVEPELRLTAREVLESLAAHRAGRPLAESWLNECDRLVFRGHYGQALARLRKLSRLEMGMSEALAGRYDQLLHLGLPAELVGQVHLELGRLWTTGGHYEQARRILEETRRLYPETPGVLLALGEVYRRVLPENNEVLELVASLYEKGGQLRQAAGAYKELISRLSGRERSQAQRRLEHLSML